MKQTKFRTKGITSQFLAIIVGLVVLFTIFYKLGQYSVSNSSLIPLVTQSTQGINTSDVSPIPVDKRINAKVLSWDPRIFLYPQFLSDQECDYIVQLAGESVQREAFPNVVVATSAAWLIEYQNNPLILNIEKRIAEWSQLPLEYGEIFFLRRFQPNEVYPDHFDFFNEETDKQWIGEQGQRLASVVMCLVAPEKGGDVIFHEVNVRVSCNKGDALLYFNLKADGTLALNSAHGFDPVQQGTKFTLTKWIRQRKVNRGEAQQEHQ